MPSPADHRRLPRGTAKLPKSEGVVKNQRDVPQLTDGSEAQLTPAEIERNKRRIEIIKRQLAGKLSASEAERMMGEEASAYK